MLWLCTLAMAAPPSSTLTGEAGTLAWTVEARGDVVHIDGSSPKWHVVHDAAPDLTPRRTERTTPDGQTATVEYTATGATVTLPDGKEVVHDRAGIWDGDTLDVRLGYLYAAGRPVVTFHGIDTASGKLYKFDSQLVGEEDCGGTRCGHVLVQLTGVLRWVGPSFHYWFGSDGRLLKFDGPAGHFEAE